MFERLLDKASKPSMSEMTLYCGKAGAEFSSLCRYLTEKYETTSEIRFPYGKNYGWSVTHRLGKKLVCDIFPEDGAFTVMLRLTDWQFKSAFPSLSGYAREYVDNRYPCGEGGWIHFRVSTPEHCKDIEKLLDEKCAKKSAAAKK